MVRILLVEDDVETVNMLRLILKRMGHEVIHSVDGSDILSLMVVSNASIILLDKRLPNGQDGWTIARLLKTSPYRHVPLVGLTALSDANEELRALQAGCQIFLPKPFSVSALQACLAALLGTTALLG